MNMEWLKELLKKAGVDESKIDGLVSDVNKELPKHFVAKQQYNEVAEAKKKLETDVAERDKQLDELKKAAGASASCGSKSKHCRLRTRLPKRSTRPT